MISEIYNDKLESKCVRLLYFFNTVDTYFLVAGVLSFVLVFRGAFNPAALILSLFLAALIAKIADFYPVFALFGIPAFVMLTGALNLALASIAKLFFVNVALFFLTQFLFMGIPNAIVARDIRVPFIMMYNSLFTVAPTTISFSTSVFYSFYLSFCLLSVASARITQDYLWLLGAGAILIAGAFISRLKLPDNIFSGPQKPDITPRSIFKKLIILNIDGARRDVFYSLDLPALRRLDREGASHVLGLETVYRALTNPAFASILTGTTPQFHGIRDNNFGQSIRTEGLPDVVPAIVYGSMHVRHFCKDSWETRVVSLPRHSAYPSR